MAIRETKATDRAAILDLHADTFGEEGPSIAQLVGELLDHPSAKPLLSLAAEQNNAIIGHVLFTPVRIDGEPSNGYIMAPLAVTGTQQKQGVGTRLIEAGLRQLAERDIGFVLVLGDPNYYSRIGFTAERGIKAPYPLEHPDAWMALELSDGALGGQSGTANCAAPLMQPEYW